MCRVLRHSWDNGMLWWSNIEMCKATCDFASSSQELTFL